MKKFNYSKIILAVGYILLFISGIMFFTYNHQIIKYDLLYGLIIILGAFFTFKAITKDNITNKYQYLIGIIFYFLLSIIFIVYSILNTAVWDFFQPYSQYDIVIYCSIVAFLIIFFGFALELLKSFRRKFLSTNKIFLILSLPLFIVTVWTLNFQNSFEYTNITGKEVQVFTDGEGGYSTFRIPTMLVIPQGEILANGEQLKNDKLIVMAEARKNSSLDDGEIDLVAKSSTNNGETWSKLQVIRTYPGGNGKIGNSTPIYNQDTGEINLLYIEGPIGGKKETYNMISTDGGQTYSEPIYVSDNVVGPGHGEFIDSGNYQGRMVVPSYNEESGSSMALYSDDGLNWHKAPELGEGNESQIVQINEQGDLLMTVRINIGLSELHGPLNKLFTTSTDGGETWSKLAAHPDIKEPICMSSLTRTNEAIYYSYPNDYFSRSKMTLVSSTDGGVTWENPKQIYQGASGYSDIGGLTNGNIAMVFENGNIEYNERITYVQIPTK